MGLARVLAVGLGPVGGDLEDGVALAGPDGAEGLALGPQRVGPALQQRPDLGGVGVGGEVEVRALTHAAKHEVAHDPAHEIERIAGRAEPLGQGPDVVEDRLQPGGDHDRPG
jgi:hypothetical protein